MTDNAAGTSGTGPFFDTLRGTVLSSIPALSALVFVVAAIKVFRVSNMEATTTVAIVSQANVVDLMKGVVLTLLPGFLAGLTAVAMWWWADAIPEPAPAEAPAPTGVGVSKEVAGAAVRDQNRRNSRDALLSSQSVFAWSMIVVAFFTVSWPIFVALLAPVVAATAVFVHEWQRQDYTTRTVWRAKHGLKWVGGAAAAISIGILTLAPSVWLPLRIITVTPGHSVSADGHPLPRSFAGYVLSSDSSGTSLLLANPRSVIQVGPHDIEQSEPLCVTPESSTRWLYLRTSQVLHLDPDNHSPYPLCPGLGTLNIFGN